MLTPRELADMVEDRTIIGHTVELTYQRGVNSNYPVTMKFVGYHEKANGDVYIDYVLHNPNTEEYLYPKHFEYLLTEFVQSFIRRGYTNPDGEGIRLVTEVQTWEL